MLVAGDDFGTRLWRLLPISGALFERLRARFVAVTEAMLLDTFLTAALQGTLVGVAFALVGLPGAVFWGMVTACAAVLPVLGSALVWLPAAGYLALSGQYGAVLFMLVAGGVVVSNLDNLVWLAVYRRVSGIYPMLTLVGALAGMRVFGMLGVLFGPLALSYFFELLGDLRGDAAPHDRAGARTREAADHGAAPGAGERMTRMFGAVIMARKAICPQYLYLLRETVSLPTLAVDA